MEGFCGRDSKFAQEFLRYKLFQTFSESTGNWWVDMVILASEDDWIIDGWLMPPACYKDEVEEVF